MSAQVDVLAVMDALIALMYQGPVGVHGANEARAAVAALIAERDALREALIRLEEAARAVQSGEWDRNSIQVERDAARAALTTGESA